MMHSKLFRKSALDRLSSPDQLDRLITITSSRAWIAITIIGVMLAAAIAWSLVGNLPTRVSGKGILIPKGGRLFDAVAPATGLVSDIIVEISDEVEEGDIVAHLRQTDVEAQYNNALANLKEKQEQLKRLHSFTSRKTNLKEKAFKEQESTLKSQITAARGRMAFLTKKLADEESLFAQRIVTRQQVEQTRNSLNQARNAVAEARNQLASLRAQSFDASGSSEQRLIEAEFAANEAQRQVDDFKSKLERARYVVAPASGRVIEIKFTVGAIISQGQPVLSLESKGSELSLLLYVPPEHGESIHTGMMAQISPSIAKKEEYGTVIGIVTRVSQFPTTIASIRSLLQSNELAQSFSSDGPPYEVRVQLETDPDSLSGYRWTSERGSRHLRLTSGTLSEAEITVRSQKPIELVIPLLRRYTGL